MLHLIPRRIFNHLMMVTFLISMILVLGVWLMRSLRFIELIVSNDMTLARYLSMVYLLLPNLAAVVLPVCATIAVVYTFYKMTAENELIIYKSFGMSNWQIMKPVFFAALVLSSLTGYLYNYLGPSTTERFSEIREQLSQEFSSGSIREGMFNEYHNTIIYVKEHTVDNQLKAIYIYDRSNKEKPFSLFAQYGYLTTVKGRNLLVLYNGCRQEIDIAQKNHKIAYFTELNYDINMAKSVKKSVPVYSGLNLWQMLTLKPNEGEIEGTKYLKILEEAHRRIIYPLLVFVLVCFGSAVFVNAQQHRRGLWKIILANIVISLVVQLSVVALLARTIKGEEYVYGAYALILSFLAAALFLVFYNRGNIKRASIGN